MQMLPRHVEWSGKPYAHARRLDFVREAREGLLGIGKALIVEGRAGRPRTQRRSPEAIRSSVQVARNLLEEGRRRRYDDPIGEPEDLLHGGFASFLRKISGRPIDLVKDQPREIAIRAVAHALDISVREVREAIAGQSKPSRKS
jgi:hypothetical protein